MLLLGFPANSFIYRFSLYHFPISIVFNILPLLLLHQSPLLFFSLPIPSFIAFLLTTIFRSHLLLHRVLLLGFPTNSFIHRLSPYHFPISIVFNNLPSSPFLLSFNSLIYLFSPCHNHSLLSLITSRVPSRVTWLSSCHLSRRVCLRCCCFCLCNSFFLCFSACSFVRLHSFSSSSYFFSFTLPLPLFINT